MGEMQLFSRDVTGKVDISDPVSVCAAVSSILQQRYAGVDFAPVELLFSDFANLYCGKFSGFYACDTLYQITSDPRLNHRAQVIGGVLADRCAAVLAAFFEARRRRVSRPADRGS